MPPLPSPSLPLPPLVAPLSAAVIARATLFANHVIASEPAATERLRAHAGKRLRIEMRGWPRLLPPWPELAFDITPAGLLEWQGEAVGASGAASTFSSSIAPALLLVVDASNPALLAAQSLAGERPRVDIEGDAAFADDVSWLLDNLRWDARDDLERFVGPLPAQALGQLGALFGQGLRQALAMAARFTPRPGARSGG